MKQRYRNSPPGLGPTPPGALYENPPDALRQLRELEITDPAFARWVLFYSERVASLALLAVGNEAPIDLKTYISQKLIEAYDIHEAHAAQKEIRLLLAR